MTFRKKLLERSKRRQEPKRFRRLLLGHHRAAVDVQDDAGDPGSVFGSQIEGRACHVVWSSKAFDRVRVHERGFLRFGDLLLVALGEDDTFAIAAPMPRELPVTNAI